MKVLLDTHAFLWYVAKDARLSATSSALLADPDTDAFLSLASLWEMAIKIGLGKLSVPQPFDVFVTDQMLRTDVRPLEISVAHLNRLTTMPFHHRDPFDRLLAAQAIAEGMPLLSVDSVFDTYGVRREW